MGTLVPSEHNLVGVSGPMIVQKYVILQSDLSNKNESQTPENLVEASVCRVLLTSYITIQSE